MHKAELQNKVESFNTQLASTSFPRVNSDDVFDNISGLKGVWTTTSSTDIIKSLESKLKNLNNDIEELQKAANKINRSSISFDFYKERV